MNKARCEICRQRLPTLKTLKSHYLKHHSKIQIIKGILKNSIINSTPRLLTRAKRRKNYDKYKTVYLHDKVQITYSNDTIVIEDESSNDNLIELTFDDAQNYTVPSLEQAVEPQGTAVTPRPGNKRRARKNGKSKKSKKLFHIGIKKVTETPKSLHEHTGEFYECHCMEKSSQKVSSDTESGSDSGKIFYCNFCGSGFQTMKEVTDHENQHQYYCKLCNQIFNIPNHREHMEQHIVRIYVCHLCGFEFICKDVLAGHLGYHFEQQTFENILNMEQDYNMYGFCNTSFSSEFYIYDYERHLKIAHFMR